MTVSANNQNETRVAEATRVFTPARVVALTVIALLALGLGYLGSAQLTDRSPSPKARTPAS